MMQATEAILYENNPSMFRASPIWFVFFLIQIPFGVGIVALLVWFIQCKMTKLTIGTNKIIFKKGILSKDERIVSIKKIRTIDIKQSLFQRIFRTGDVWFLTTGDVPEIIAADMDDPEEIRAIVLNRME